MASPFYVALDWAKDGTFGTAPSIDDVTLLVRDTLQCRYGRSNGALTGIAAGTGSVVLDNASRRFSPLNTASPIYPNVKPARPALVQRTVSGTAFTIFRGHTDDNPTDPDPDTKRVTVGLVDGLADFADVPIATPLYQGIRSGAAVNAVLDAAGWTGGRDIDDGASVFPWWWEDGTDAYQALQKIVASEGPPALLAMGVSGEIVFRDRQHRLVRSASTTSQATLRAAPGLEPVMQGMTYSANWGSVVNSVQLAVEVRAAGGAGLVEVWSTDEIINIGASASYVVVLQASDPFLGAVAPVQDTDYTLVSGSITSATLSRTSGLSTSVTLTAGAGGAVLQGLQLRAYSVPVIRTVQVTSTDAPSIVDFGAKGLPSGTEPVWCNPYDAQAIADLWVLTRKQPPALVTCRFVCQHTQTAKLGALLALDLSDRVTVVEAETVLNGPFFVEEIVHTVQDLTQHTIEITCEQVPAAPSSVFVIGTSTLNGADPLGY